MATLVHGQSEAVIRLCKALGLAGRMVRSVTLRCALDEVVTLTVEELATKEQIEAFTAAVESGDLSPEAIVVLKPESQS